MFYIGQYKIDPPFLLAPMAGVSEMPFRVLAFEFGAGLATTELISAKGIFYRNQRTEQYLKYNREVEFPYSLQLFGGEIESMTQAAIHAAEAGAHIIDINMGCPVKKVTKTGAGSSLLCDPKRAAELLKSMRQAVGDKVPVTAKIRTGWDAENINCVEMAKALEDAGCAALAMHARTRAQGYSGYATWDLIGLVKQAVKMPIIGNGDVVTVQDAHRMLKQTGCDGVMIGRGALGNPWIFNALKTGSSAVPTPAERFDVVLRHFKAHVTFHEELCADNINMAHQRAVRSFRSHLIWYSKGLINASPFREKAMQLESAAAVEDAVADFFTTADLSKGANMLDDGIDYRQAFG